MQLEHIALFNKIAKTKSISKVAQASHLSQPALSLQMRRLEDEIGQKLFERSNKGIELTPAGEILQKYAEQFNRIYENFMEDIDNLQSSEGPFRIAAFPDVANYAIPCTLFAANRAFPNHVFYLSSMSNEEVVQSVLSGQVDTGFVLGQRAEPELFCKPAFCDKECLVAHYDYACDNIKKMVDIKKHPLLLLHEQQQEHHPLQEYLRAYGMQLADFDISCQVDSTESAKSAVLAKQGLAFLPYMSIKKELYLKQIKIVELEEIPIDYCVYVITRNLSVQRGVNEKKQEIIRYIINTVSNSIC